MIKPEILWENYAAAWSLAEAVRRSELPLCLAEDITYCDPNGLITGCEGLSAYMAGFQQQVPGGRFEIRTVRAHHGRSLAHWALLLADGAVAQTGVSFAEHASDGRFRAITGFFDPAVNPSH